MKFDILQRIERLTGFLRILSKPDGDVYPRNAREYNEALKALKTLVNDVKYVEE